MFFCSSSADFFSGADVYAGVSGSLTGLDFSDSAIFFFT